MGYKEQISRYCPCTCVKRVSYPDETGLVVRGTVEGDGGHPPHVQVRVLQGLQELT